MGLYTSQPGSPEPTSGWITLTRTNFKCDGSSSLQLPLPASVSPASSRRKPVSSRGKGKDASGDAVILLIELSGNTTGLMKTFSSKSFISVHKIWRFIMKIIQRTVVHNAVSSLSCQYHPFACVDGIKQCSQKLWNSGETWKTTTILQTGTLREFDHRIVLRTCINAD